MPSPSAPVGRTTHRAATTRPAVTVLSGFWPAATMAVARTLLAADPALLVVRYDVGPAHDGAPHRVLRDGTGPVEDVRLDLVDGCVCCTLRADAPTTLARLAAARPGRDIVLVLPEVVEPETLAAACAHGRVAGRTVCDLVRFDSYVTVVAADHLLDGLASTDDLGQLGIAAAPGDRRRLADVIARQIEYADTVVLWGGSIDQAFETHRLGVLLSRMAPWAVHLRAGDQPTIDATRLAGQLRHTDRHRPETPTVLDRGVEGHLIGVHEPVADCGVVSAVFRARRPLHPARLYAALADVTAGPLRSRGHLWLANRPEAVIGWECAGGGLTLRTLGRWLVDLPDEQWEQASPQRRLAAALDWDPYYGDRHSNLVFVGVDFDPVDLHRRLAACLLTDAELADGEAGWRNLPDPFTGGGVGPG
ncbi:GTP-binding protein [Solwaraspora sp. WMMA2080]|uniref:CobW family GTP-binding protein n=1 Tax=unclassified Solwaraspora TaxID=2627926 RepID=UPI00248B8004|nr:MULTISPECIES: GTP-binding protein [unclassified Solwaraspora]WBB95991.1 GTP-binding protein [Solwaraspora sp. WMMA2059]WBC20105.1 GTP-binding protein [Solwaraspora sp. WMMA2080]